MQRPRHLAVALAIFGACAPGVRALADAPPTDPASGLIMDENWQIVAAHCGACHSTQLVTQNRGSRETWEHLIRWMQATQGLWPFPEPTETQILDYLAANYGPVASSRRQPLPPELLPPNPWAGD